MIFTSKLPDLLASSQVHCIRYLFLAAIVGKTLLVESIYMKKCSKKTLLVESIYIKKYSNSMIFLISPYQLHAVDIHAQVV